MHSGIDLVWESAYTML